MPFSLGRLTRIARTDSEIEYGYDRFGRLTQDGELTYGYDANGNRAEIGYPGGVTARFTHDFADRDSSLEVHVGNAASKTIVSGATYKPFGPLAGLTLGNGLSETRDYTNRYFPECIDVPGRLSQTYTTDPTGNIRGFDRTVGTDHFPANFTYQDPQYFLTQSDGPWGQQAWSYDRIGNRLSETSPNGGSTYTYLSNPSGGHNPKLFRIEPSPGGDPGSGLDFGYDASGNQTAVVDAGGPGRTSFLDVNAESHLSLLRTSDGPASTELLYDGRGFLRRSRLTFSNSPDFEQTEPVYTSEGLLLSKHHQKQTTQVGGGVNLVEDTAHVFYFAGRPVAQWTERQGGGNTWLYLTTCHLGTPIQATDDAGAIAWEGGLDPFGTPFALSAASMETAGIFLRFPGQWDDPSFRSSDLQGSLFYNVHRWYDIQLGRYASADPVRLGRKATNLYSYALARPTRFVDTLGLFHIDSSCDNLECVPQYFGFANMLNQLKLEIQWQCEVLDMMITDVALLRCLQGKCDNGKVYCKGADNDRENHCNSARAGGYGPAGGEAILCPGNWNYGVPPGYLGETVIHEWAHNCRWRHGGGSGVPNDPGE